MTLYCPHCSKSIPLALRRKVASEERQRARQRGGESRASSANMAAIGKRGGIAARGKSGRKPSTDRCACGQYTRATADRRNHRCL